MAEGFAAQQLLLQLQAYLLADATITDLRKASAAEIMAGADKNLVDGSDETLQLMDVACQVMTSCEEYRVLIFEYLVGCNANFSSLLFPLDRFRKYFMPTEHYLSSSPGTIQS